MLFIHAHLHIKHKYFKSWLFDELFFTFPEWWTIPVVISMLWKEAIKNIKHASNISPLRVGGYSTHDEYRENASFCFAAPWLNTILNCTKRVWWDSYRILHHIIGCNLIKICLCYLTIIDTIHLLIYLSRALISNYIQIKKQNEFYSPFNKLHFIQYRIRWVLNLKYNIFVDYYKFV